MGLTSHLFRIPRPQVRHTHLTLLLIVLTNLKSFLYLMTLRTGVELIALSLLFNKISGLYGLLAVLTGFHLSPLQLSMYIYSLLALLLTLYLFPHIRRQSPFHNLLLAWFYLLDSVINAAYTAAFALSWFLAISSHHSDSNAVKGPGASMIAETSGFTDPEFNASSVSIDGLKPGQDTVVSTSPRTSSQSATASPNFSHGILQPESMESLTSILLLWTLRCYFIFILLSYARYVLRSHITAISRSNTALHTGSPNPNELENPFAPSKPEGAGWQGRLGRLMIAIGRSYWLGAEAGYEEEIRWMDTVGGKFRKSGESSSLEAGLNGNTNVERERRRRSGTGPPAPPPGLVGGGQPGMLSPDAAGQGVKMQSMEGR
jgi:inositol phosphorylceramide synthase regulatory subunit